MKNYKIIKTKTAGINRNKVLNVADGFKSIEEAGKWIIENSIEELGVNTGISDEGKGLQDYTTSEPYEVIFELGDTRFNDGDWMFDIVEEEK